MKNFSKHQIKADETLALIKENLLEDENIVKQIRLVKNVCPANNFSDEEFIIDSLYESVLNMARNKRGSYFFATCGGWTVYYFRKKKKFNKKEKFSLNIYFSFVDYEFSSTGRRK